MTVLKPVRLLALAALTVAVTVPAMAQTDTAKPAPKKEKKSCRRYTVTGSIVGTRAVCHTEAEWAAIDGANAKTVDDTLTERRGRP